jgi:hypothetical protein
MGLIKKTSTHGWDNFQDAGGKWVSSWTVKNGDVLECRYTRLGNLWNSMVDRCNPNSFVAKSHQSYSGVSNDFSSFEYFADWAVGQPGFDLLESDGKRYALDKDILICGGRSYSAEACSFVPQRINNLLITGKAKGLPIGVSWEADRGKFGACISLSGKNKRLGRFESQDLAHSAWQRAKADEIDRLVYWYAERPGFNRLVAAALRSRSGQLRADIANQVVTESL